MSDAREYNWHNYTKTGALEAKTKGDTALKARLPIPTDDVSGTLYDDAPRQDYMLGLLTQFETALEGLSAEEQQQLLVFATEINQGGVTWLGLKAMREKMTQVLQALFKKGLIPEDKIPASLRSEGPTPNKTPSKGIWNAPGPRPGG